MCKEVLQRQGLPGLIQSMDTCPVSTATNSNPVAVPASIAPLSLVESQLVIPSGSGCGAEWFKSSSDGEDIDALTILLSLLECLEAEHCRTSIRRHAVLKKLNPLLLFGQVEQALAQGIVRVGPEQGHGWISKESSK